MIKGIDGQIMINRQTDFAKDTAALNKRTEAAQTQFSNTFREQVQENQKRVPDTNKSEKENAISRDGHNANDQERQGKKRGDRGDEGVLEGEALPEVGQPLDAIGRRLDIMA